MKEVEFTAYTPTHHGASYVASLLSCRQFYYITYDRHLSINIIVSLDPLIKSDIFAVALI